MSFSSRRRNYLLTPHRRDGLIEWMKSMLMHSFVLDALETTGADTFSHFEVLIDEHRQMELAQSPSSDGKPSRLRQLVPTVGTFHTHLPLRRAFEAYNKKYGLTKRKHICISFNELRHILNLAQIMALRCGDGDGSNNGNSGRGSAGHGKSNSTRSQDEEEMRALMRWESHLGDVDDLLNTPVMKPVSAPSGSDGSSPPILDLDGGDVVPTAAFTAVEANTYRGPKMITFDGDQTLYSDGANFESNPRLALYLYLLLRNGVTVAVVTAAGYEYQTEKYELRLSGLLAYFRDCGLPAEDCANFYLFGGECNYLLRLGEDYKLHAVKESGAGGWLTATKYIGDTPGNWSDEEVKCLLDIAEKTMEQSITEQNLRARLIRKKRAVGLIPKADETIPREALDETILRVQAELQQCPDVSMPFCAFNGGSDCWVDCGNKRVGVRILQSYLGVSHESTLHIGDQFLNTGNDFAARSVCPCVWITSPEETTYILKSILRLAGVSLDGHNASASLVVPDASSEGRLSGKNQEGNTSQLDFKEISRRTESLQKMDVYTGEIIKA